MSAERASGDLVEHELSDKCVCGPTPVPVKNETDGSMDWIYVHHTLSGAEFDEPDYEGPPRPTGIGPG